MGHIHTDFGQHDHTASAFIVRLDMGEPKLMLHMHKKLGIYLQFGGHVELDETPWQAICHELVEESGYEVGQLKILQPKDRVKSLKNSTLHPVAFCHNTHVFNETHFHTDLEYSFVADSAPKHKIQEGESENIIYVSRKELEQRKFANVGEDIRTIGLSIFDIFIKKWEQVDTTEFA